jgi:prepilin-type N-terminal cleavage/methylation domain-containing protein
MQDYLAFKKKFASGFTLIELLIVIAILGVLAAAILVSINPLEQLARGRDGGRKSTVGQLGHAVQSYYTSQNAVYPTQGVLWMTTGTAGGLTGLQASGEMKSLPPAITPACGDAAVVQNGYCYRTNGTDAVVYVQGESASEKTRAGCTAAQTVWIVWSSADGKTGATCTAGATTYPAVGITGLR